MAMKPDAYLQAMLALFVEAFRTVDIYCALKYSMDRERIEDSTDEPIPSDPSYGDYDMECLA